MRTPCSTYRLQVTPDFDLHAAARVLPYLHDLGVPSRVDTSRGGAEGLASLSAQARRLGMGVLVDIVPNHMGIATPAENAWWWDVLQHGRESEHATAFDIEWPA